MIRFLVFISVNMALNCMAEEYTLSELYKTALERHPEGKILQSKIKELEFGVNKIQSESYPTLSAVVGGERRQAESESDLNNNRLIAELRLKYNLMSHYQNKDEVKAIQQILKKTQQEFEWWKLSLKRRIIEASTKTKAFIEKISAVREELKANTVLRESVQKRRKSGLVSESDILDIQLRNDQLLSSLNEYQEELDHSLDILRKITFLGHDDSIKLQGGVPHKHYKIDLNHLKIQSHSLNQQVVKNKFMQLSSLSELKKVEKNNLPEINLDGRFGRMRIDEQYTSSNNQVEGLVGLYVNIPIYDGGSRKSTRQIYEERYQQRLLKSEMALQNEAIDVTHKFELLESIHYKVDLFQQSLKRGKVYTNKVLSDYKRGVKNSLDLVSSRDRLLNLKLELVEAKTKYILTILELEKLSGVDLMQEKL